MTDYLIDGNLSLDVTPGATVVENLIVQGNISTLLTTGASIVESLIVQGTLSTTLTPESTCNENYMIQGALNTSLTPNSTCNENYIIPGTVSISIFNSYSNQFEFDVDIPITTIEFSGDPGTIGTFDVNFKIPEIAITAVSSIGTLDINFVMPKLEFYVANEFDISFVQPIIDFTGYVGTTGTFELGTPSTTVDLSGDVSVSGELDVKLSVTDVSFTGYQNISSTFDIAIPICDINLLGDALFDISLPMPRVALIGNVGTIGSVDIHIPVIGISFSGQPGEVGSFEIDIPNIPVDFNAAVNITGEFDINISLLASFTGEIIPVTILYKGIAMNASHYAISEYTSDFNLSSIAGPFNGKYFGANSDGIFLLGGDTFNNNKIHSRIKTPPYDFWKNIIRNARDAWITYRTDGYLTLVIEVDENEQYEYSTELINNKIHEENIEIGQGFDNRFYSFEIKNNDGCDFDLEKLVILVEEVKQRRR